LKKFKLNPKISKSLINFYQSSKTNIYPHKKSQLLLKKYQSFKHFLNIHKKVFHTLQVFHNNFHHNSFFFQKSKYQHIFDVFQCNFNLYTFCCNIFFIFFLQLPHSRKLITLYSYCCCNNIEFTSHVCLHIVLNRAQDIYGERKKIKCWYFGVIELHAYENVFNFFHTFFSSLFVCYLSDWCKGTFMTRIFFSIANFTHTHTKLYFNSYLNPRIIVLNSRSIRDAGKNKEKNNLKENSRNLNFFLKEKFHKK